MVYDRVKTWGGERGPCPPGCSLGPRRAGLGGGIRHRLVESDREGPFRRAPPNPVVFGSEGWAEAFLKGLREQHPQAVYSGARTWGLDERKASLAWPLVCLPP